MEGEGDPCHDGGREEGVKEVGLVGGEEHGRDHRQDCRDLVRHPRARLHRILGFLLGHLAHPERALDQLLAGLAVGEGLAKAGLGSGGGWGVAFLRAAVVAFARHSEQARS